MSRISRGPIPAKAASLGQFVFLNLTIGALQPCVHFSLLEASSCLAFLSKLYKPTEFSVQSLVSSIKTILHTVSTYSSNTFNSSWVSHQKFKNACSSASIVRDPLSPFYSITRLADSRSFSSFQSACPTEPQGSSRHGNCIRWFSAATPFLSFWSIKTNIFI